MSLVLALWLLLQPLCMLLWTTELVDSASLRRVLDWWHTGVVVQTAYGVMHSFECFSLILVALRGAHYLSEEASLGSRRLKISLTLRVD